MISEDDENKPPAEFHYMNRKERAACGTLCICLALSVMSAVALIYLSVIIYLPAHREMESGFGEVSVMCTTIERREVEGDIEACRWTSCSEWCLSKGGADCTHLFVSVRSNGTDVLLQGCRDKFDKYCASLDLNTIEKRNCKKDHKCTRLDKMFRCEDGLCWNITDVYACSYREEDAEPPVNCEKKRECVELSGMYDCNMGVCRRIQNWTCERRCIDIPIQEKNVVFRAGDHIVTAHCERALDVSTKELVWDAASYSEELLLIASCTAMEPRIDGDSIKAWDCVNGTILPKALVGPMTNYTVLTSEYLKLGYYNKLDRNGVFLPFEEDIMIHNRTRLKINFEGCVNTLKDECKSFYNDYAKDGRNDTSPSRFPCYYAPHNSEFVVKQFDLSRTRNIFLLLFVIPSTLLVLSCGSLLICSRILTIDNTGHMTFRCCTKSPDDLQYEIKSNDYSDQDEPQDL